MRIRTLLAFGLGTALGAGVTYLADPEHGGDRRVEARRWAMRQGRQQAVAATGAAVRAARTYVTAAGEGFRESLQEPAPGAPALRTAR